MKGQTNAMESVITVKTGVTVVMLQSIPEGTPWDLTLKIMSGTTNARYILHGIGSVPKIEFYNEVPIVGAYSSYTKISNSWQNYVARLISGAWIDQSTNNLTLHTSNGSMTVTSDVLSSATLCLYGGGEPELLNISTPLYAEVSA